MAKLFESEFGRSSWEHAAAILFARATRRENAELRLLLRDSLARFGLDEDLALIKVMQKDPIRSGDLPLAVLMSFVLDAHANLRLLGKLADIGGAF